MRWTPLTEVCEFQQKKRRQRKTWKISRVFFSYYFLTFFWRWRVEQKKSLLWVRRVFPPALKIQNELNGFALAWLLDLGEIINFSPAIFFHYANGRCEKEKVPRRVCAATYTLAERWIIMSVITSAQKATRDECVSRKLTAKKNIDRVSPDIYDGHEIERNVILIAVSSPPRGLRNSNFRAR